MRKDNEHSEVEYILLSEHGRHTNDDKFSRIIVMHG